MREGSSCILGMEKEKNEYCHRECIYGRKGRGDDEWVL